MAIKEPNHDEVLAVLKAILAKYNIQYNQDYQDRNPEKYHAVDGKSIKFWNSFPLSGDNLDAALYNCNVYLKRFGLILVQHIWYQMLPREVTVVVRGMSSQGTVSMPSYTPSLLVKPLPDLLDSLTPVKKTA